MIKKTFYEAPETELILVRFEENILSGFNQTNQTEYMDRDSDSDVDEL